MRSGDGAADGASVATRLTATAVVCTRNRPDLLPACLASLAAAMDGGDQLIVVESGESRAAEALSELPVDRLHLTSTDRRKTVKLNRALREARGEIVVLTDDDCRVSTDWIAAMVAPFADPRVGIAFGPVAGLDHVPGGAPAAHLPPGPAPQENWAYAHGAAMAVRRRAVFEVGGFDERLGPGAPTHGEEADMVVRLAAAGWTCVLADAPPVTHLEWRDPAQTLSNLLVYERGAGAWIGAGLRRDPRRVGKLLLLRLRYQAELWGDRSTRGPAFGPRTTGAFIGGLARGLRYPPRRWL